MSQTCKHVNAKTGTHCGMPQFHKTRHGNGLLDSGKTWSDNESTPESRAEDDKDRTEGTPKQVRV